MATIYKQSNISAKEKNETVRDQNSPSTTVINVITILIMLSGIVFYNWSEDYEFLTNYLSIAVLGLNALSIYKVRKNIVAQVLFLMITYFNYSIVQSEYLAEHYQVQMNNLRLVNQGEAYIDGVFYLFLFTAILTLFVKELKPMMIDFKTESWHNNSIIFYPLMAIIIFIGIFFNGQLSEAGVYEIGVSAVFEYTFILFPFLFYFAGNNKTMRILGLLTAAFIIIQELSIGGRITTMQVGLVVIIMMFLPKLTFNRIILIGGVGLIGLTAIGAFRGNTMAFDLGLVFEQFFDSLFVQNTAVFAFNSTVTHIAAAPLYGTAIRLKSLFGFIMYIVLGSNAPWAEFSDVTDLANVALTNVGGGIYFSHFYFWGGVVGVILASLLLATLVNKLVGNFNTNSRYWKFIGIFFVVTSSRWYLYSPLQIFRACFFFGSIAYLLFMWFDKHVTLK